ncbi:MULTISPECIES: ABC transporter substrate-binding protein [Paenibacillus]|uniref:ABC transporter substrate-binding protein n=1 Tax=Paenibacillus naphthalenovorans TaxID=162209 RepID=A0A0U2ILH1_9BACL|nr:MULTISPECIES: sugar ABC transporter substrate-binding protein [Paenibacillus]ALS20779.1 ABC transporter substrate-binding protein [Paenibacillus naphthalenovorans]SDI22364.1 multiple sugar transport system substrate-binding protein [Paenibacillus naphthalenovorans]
MNPKKVLFPIMTAALVAGLAGCGGEETTGANANADKSDGGEKVELRVAWWGGQARHDKMNQLFDLFEQKHPNIKVSREFTTENQYAEKFTTQAAGGNAPDVMQTSSFFQFDFVKRNMMLDLDPLVASGDLNVKDFDPVDVGGGKVNDKLYAISLGHNITGVIYNTVMFKNAGLDMPKNNWTWDDYVATARALQKSLGNDAWATEDEGGVYRVLELYAQQRGKSVFTENGLGIDKKDLTDWFTFWDQMRKEGLTPPAAIQSEQGDKTQEQSMLARGKVAMISKSSNQLKIYQGSTKDELGIVSYPMDPNGEKKVPLIVASLGISAKTKYPKEAAMLIDFVVNDPDAAKIFKGEHGPQASKAMQEVIKPLLGKPEEKEYAFVNEMMPSTKPYPTMPGGSTSVQKLLLSNNEAIAFGKKTIPQAVDDFFAQANQILNR